MKQTNGFHIFFLSLLILVGQNVRGQSGLNFFNKRDSKLFKRLDIPGLEKACGNIMKRDKNSVKFSTFPYGLTATMNGFFLTPEMGLYSWMAFTPSHNKIIVNGKLVVDEISLPLIERQISGDGLQLRSISTCLTSTHPFIFYIFFVGKGLPEVMSERVEDIFKTLKSLMPSYKRLNKNFIKNTLDTVALDLELGHKGSIFNGTYSYIIERGDVKPLENGIKISSFLGLRSRLSWQGEPEHAAIFGQLILLEFEVKEVIQALTENHIDVISLRDFSLSEEPRVFVVQFWGIGFIGSLSKGVKTALSCMVSEQPPIDAYH